MIQTAENARKLLTPALKAAVDKRVRELLDLSTSLWPEHKSKFQDAPEVRYDIKNRFGGVAITGGRDDWTIRLNIILCYENEEHFIEQTVGHEIAHLVCRIVHGNSKILVEKGQPVHHGHVHVEQNQPRAAGRLGAGAGLAQRAQGGFAVLGHEHLPGHAHATQQQLVQEVRGAVVVDQQHTR